MVLEKHRHLSLPQSSSTSTVLPPAAFGFLHLSHVQKMKGLSKQSVTAVTPAEALSLTSCSRGRYGENCAPRCPSGQARIMDGGLPAPFPARANPRWSGIAPPLLYNFNDFV
jgi:hypothetical protein